MDTKFFDILGELTFCSMVHPSTILWGVVVAAVVTMAALITSIVLFETQFKTNSFVCKKGRCIPARNGPYETKEICRVVGCSEDTAT